MICWMREAVIRPGHPAEARALAHDITGYDHARGGAFADLAALAAWQARADADTETQAIPARGIPRFVDGSIRDSVFEAR